MTGRLGKTVAAINQTGVLVEMDYAVPLMRDAGGGSVPKVRFAR